ncbi:MAG: hypothetical protein KGL16_11290 [Acidobacteriota bacterium]|nr:hypothetical protein [Acidobacteriota bacterium]
MATTAAAATTTLRSRQRALSGVRITVWQAVLYSRVVVVAAGMWGAQLAVKVPGWQRFDPHGISIGMGPLGNLLGAASVRWDAISYIGLAEHGYTSARESVYYPLYSILIRLVMFVVGSPVIAGVLVSLGAFAIGLELIHRLARWHLGTRVADATVLLMAFSPFSFVFSAVYSASLLMACAVGAFYLARQGRFVLAAVVATCAALARVEGILLLGPLALMYWNSRGRPRNLSGLWSGSLAALALPVLALGGFLTYLHQQGWGWLAPFTNQNPVNTGRSLVGPPLALAESVRDTGVELIQQLHGTTLVSDGVLVPAAQNVFYLGVLAVAILGLISAWRLLPKEYVLFGALAIIVFTSSAVAMEPLKGIDRYMLPIFPLWIGVAAWAEKRGLMPLVMALSSVMLVFYTVEFTRWVSVF